MDVSVTPSSIPGEISLIFTSIPGEKTIPIGVVLAVENARSTVPWSGISTLYGITGNPVSIWNGQTLIAVLPSSDASSTPPNPSSTNAPNTQGISSATAKTAASAATAASASTTSATAAPIAAGSNGFSSGVLGGVAAACVVGAALIAVAVTWGIMRHRTKYYRGLAAGAGSAAHGEGFESTSPEKGMKSSVSPMSNGADPRFLVGILPPSSDDREVKQRVSGMLDAAAIHVDNFYDSTKFRVPIEVEAQLATFDSPFLTKSTREMLAEGLHPKVVITRALTETLVSSIDAQSGPSWSLLPSEFTALSHTPNNARNETRSGQREPALFWWRQLTVHLSSSAKENDAHLEHRQQVIAELVNNFQTAFEPWRKIKYTQQQETDALVGTFLSAADTGIWLFSQRSTFVFAWSKITPPAELEIKPALFKTSDANGQPLAKQHEVISRKLERAGGGAL